MQRWTVTALTAFLVIPASVAMADARLPSRGLMPGGGDPIQLAQYGGGGRHDMRREIEALRDENRRLADERDAQAETIRRLEDRRGGRRHRGGRRAELRDELHDLRQQNEHLQNVVDERQAKYLEARSLARKRADQIHELQSLASSRADKIGRLETVVANKQEMLSKRDQEVTRFKAIMDRIRERREGGGPLRDRLEQLQERVAERDREIAHLRDELERFERGPVRRPGNWRDSRDQRWRQSN